MIAGDISSSVLFLKRYSDFATHLEDLCDSVDTASGSMPGIVELESEDSLEGLTASLTLLAKLISPS